MMSLDMYGPYDFDEDNVKRMKEQMGNYALGHMTDDNKFSVEYVGRSLTNLRGELSQRLGTHGHHTKFKASISSSVKEVFKKNVETFMILILKKMTSIHPHQKEQTLLVHVHKMINIYFSEYL